MSRRALFLLSAFLALPAAACAATWQETGQRTIEVGAVTVDGADHALARAITRTCAPAVAGMPAGPARSAAVDACVAEHFHGAVDGIHAADAALRSGQATIDAGVETTWVARLPCVARAVADALVAIEAAGAELPPELMAGRATLESFAAQCHAATTAGGP